MFICIYMCCRNGLYKFIKQAATEITITTAAIVNKLAKKSSASLFVTDIHKMSEWNREWKRSLLLPWNTREKTSIILLAYRITEQKTAF